MPFTEESARFFFGREADQAVLIANLFAARVTILYGASGVGKSSLLRAGVVKELDRRNAEARRTAGEPELRVVYFKEWQDRPLLRLEQRICASAGRAEPSDEHALGEVLAQAAEGFPGDVMVLLDQFEDYFKYPDTGPRAFDAELAAALQRDDLPVSFVLSLRDDALSRLDRFQLLTEHEPGDLVYDSMYLGIARSSDLLIIQITLSSGRTLEQKRALYRGIADNLGAAVGLRPEDVWINLVEVAKENWSFGNGVASYAAEGLRMPASPPRSAHVQGRAAQR